MKTIVLSIVLGLTALSPAVAQDSEFEIEAVNEATLESEVEEMTSDEVAAEQAIARQEAERARREAKNIKSSFAETKRRNQQMKGEVRKTMQDVVRMQAITTGLRRNVKKIEAEVKRKEREKANLARHVERLQRTEEKYRARLEKSRERMQQLKTAIAESTKFKRESDRDIAKYTRALKRQVERNKRLAKQCAQIRQAALKSSRKAKRLSSRLR